ncbi:hypothetical protein DITRI_Ditri13aG0036200 [Diplodiscus trichospermus]
MNMHTSSTIFLLICIFSCCNHFIPHVETCACKSSGELRGTDPPPGECNNEDSSVCCAEGMIYTIYDCSPHVSSHTKANLTLKSFDRGGNGGWFDGEARCLKDINIHGNGESVMAKVVDQCDSTMGCDSDHNYEPPCENNIVRATKGVWNALGVPKTQWSRMEIHWSDA